MGFALFAPRGKSGKRMNHGICTFCTKGQKRQKDEFMGFVLFAPRCKMMNHGICTFCAKGQNDESWDLHFLHQGAKAAKG